MFKKKILIVGTFPPNIGGISSYIQILLKSNLNKKFHFIEFSINRPTMGISKDVNNYNLIFHIGFITLIKSFIITFKHIAEFFFILIIKKPKIVHIHTPDYIPFWENSIYILISKIFMKKIILHIHAHSFDTFYNNEHRLFKIFIRKTLINSDKIIVLSKKQKNFFLKLIPISKIHIIQNAINFNNFKYISSNKNKSNIIKIIFIGGEEAKRKGIYDVFKAINIVTRKIEQNICFIFIGRCNIQKMTFICKKLKINNYVKFLGYVIETEKIKILKESHIFILPSYAEGLPIAILEAMASGLPIISTTVGSISEVIEEGINGFLIEPGDYIKLAEKIIFLLKNKSIRTNMGLKNKQKIINKFDINILCSQIEKIYNGI